MEKQVFDMQQDAVRRVREMQRRAKISSENEEKPANNLPKEPQLPREEEKTERKKGLAGLINLKDFAGNSEEMLILALAVLISRESDDRLLSLALLYLLI